MASMLSGTADVDAESSDMGAGEDTGLTDGVSVVFADLSCRQRSLTSGMGAAASDSSSSEASESVADCTECVGEAYRQ